MIKISFAVELLVLNMISCNTKRNELIFESYDKPRSFLIMIIISIGIIFVLA